MMRSSCNGLGHFWSCRTLRGMSHTVWTLRLQIWWFPICVKLGFIGFWSYFSLSWPFKRLSLRFLGRIWGPLWPSTFALCLKALRSSLRIHNLYFWSLCAWFTCFWNVSHLYLWIVRILAVIWRKFARNSFWRSFFGVWIRRNSSQKIDRTKFIKKW